MNRDLNKGKYIIITGRYVRTFKLIIEPLTQMHIPEEKNPRKIMESFEPEHMHSVRDHRTTLSRMHTGTYSQYNRPIPVSRYKILLVCTWPIDTSIRNRTR